MIVLAAVIAAAGILWAVLSRGRPRLRLGVAAVCVVVAFVVASAHPVSLGGDECGAGRYAWDCD